MAGAILSAGGTAPVSVGFKPAEDSWNQRVISFFDRMAPEWDARMIIDEAKLSFILDAAGVRKGAVVLDVACGTGVLFPYYLRRNVARVIGVDISAEMVRIAAQKVADPRFEVICGDIQRIPVRSDCDCCVIYNAFPHFEDPRRLVASLARWLKPGGRLTVAHSMGLEALRRHHAGSAAHVSREMLSAEELAAVLAPWFAVDTMIADREKYIVSGKRKEIGLADF
ncbi:MAG TPA: class I SAM-dependent methyltransferase [Firmicutes bacterium]|uniref:Class I SAM-dependent methyltransferase n=1 Tax=Capillibacterium thermochitinicola TaxID=2699427 RepID=A0A8J6I2V8_9FIRM|nr:class I SAM-dependent methyltransferase [Capillibacterium thermochitinicola]MBA2133674.1 class I SAM-dependent methyltransferase [Capillibacterium thermochitinicola]HHW11604.1 class I SAM-dependent methyltransferase [Bacillota bacterium]